jgi:hypothetical protein
MDLTFKSDDKGKLRIEYVPDVKQSTKAAPPKGWPKKRVIKQQRAVSSFR